MLMVIQRGPGYLSAPAWKGKADGKSKAPDPMMISHNTLTKNGVQAERVSSVSQQVLQGQTGSQLAKSTRA